MRYVPAEAARLRELFQVITHAGGLEEDLALRRTPGAAFNPRPARLVQLVVQDGDQTSELAIAATLLSSAPAPTQQRAASADSPEQTAAVMAGEILSCEEPETRKTMQRHSAREADDSILTVAFTIAYATILDAARHLHMHAGDKQDRAAAYSRLAASFASLNRETSMAVALRLREKTRIALDRSAALISAEET